MNQSDSHAWAVSAQDMEQWSIALRAMPKEPRGLIPWLVDSVKPFFPFERVLLIHGEHVAGQIRIAHVASHGHSDEFLQQLSGTFDLSRRGCLSWWLQHRAPFCIDPDEPPAFASAFELEEIRAFNLGRIAAHGVVSPTGNAGTYFSFAGLPQPPGEWHLDMLRLIAPMLNDLFVRHLAASQNAIAQHGNLTPRQRDIVRLAARGLSSKGIGRELDISEKTVRNQLTAIYECLGVRDYRGMLAAMR